MLVSISDKLTNVCNLETTKRNEEPESYMVSHINATFRLLHK